MWRIETTAEFDKSITKLDRRVQRWVLSYLDDLASADDPRGRGKGLTGRLAGFWRYRVGDYRVVAEIRERELVVIAITVAHRSRVYDR